MKKIVVLIGLLTLALLALAGCGKSDAASGNSKDVTIGATSGPYTDVVNKAIKPLLEKKGYKVTVKEFTDYILPNKALAEGSLTANLFQHKIYMENYAKENNVKLTQLITVPTAPMGIYSKNIKSLANLKSGAKVAVPKDPTNEARALLLLQDAGLVTLKDNTNPLTVSENDIAKNTKNIKLLPVDAGQLPRMIEDADLSLVPGNFAIAAKMNLLSAIKLENMNENYRNGIVIDSKNKDTQFSKDIKAVIESKDFESIIDKDFKGFSKPQWMTK